MNYVRITTTVVSMIMLAALSGCDSKKDKAGQAQPPQQAAPATPPTAGKAQTPVTASPKDEADAAALKDVALARFKSGDFAAIYKDASPGFREVGPEKQFVALWQQQMQQTGPFKEIKEISRSVRPQDKFLIYVYQVQYEKLKKELRLTFGRSAKGKMELTGINQRDSK